MQQLSAISKTTVIVIDRYTAELERYTYTDEREREFEPTQVSARQLSAIRETTEIDRYTAELERYTYTAENERTFEATEIERDSYQPSVTVRRPL